MRARSAWKAPLLAVLALLVAWQGQMALAGPRPIDGFALYAAAIVLYASLLGGHAVVTSRAGARRPDGSSAVSRQPRAFRVLLSLSILSTAAALVAFWLSGHDDWGWTLHLLSLMLLIATAVSLPGITEIRSGAKSHALTHVIRGRAGEWILLILVLLFALAVRVWHADSIPPGLYYDEAREGVVARRILAEPAYRPIYIEYIERPAHHAYLVALSFGIFGANIASLRFVPAAFGVLNVLAAYLLFNRLFGREKHGGLIAAALLAVTRYDVTFSRIVFDGDSTPFFMMLTLFFLHRGLTSRRQSDFVLAGLTLGVGQGFYLPMRIFALLLGGLGLCLGADRARRERALTYLKSWTPHLLIALLAMLLAIAPIVEYALRAPQIFFGRNATASIFYERAEPDLLVALYNSTVKHLGMFNYQGDQNARHNLPGAPMLDPLSGVLFLLGLGLAVRRWREGPNFVMLVLFAGMLQAGILSTDWEAPQALRSIGVLPSIVYFMTLALLAPAPAISRLCVGLFARRQAGGLNPPALPCTRQEVAYRRPLLARSAPALLFAGIFLVVAWLNLDLYFNHQAYDAAVWRAHSPVEAWAAVEMERLAPTHDIILPARYEASPTIKFLAPEIVPVRTITATDQFPLSPVPVRPVVMFLDSTLLDKLDEVRRLYPSAEIRELRPPDNSEPAAYEIIMDFP
jgi:4-amino-4-deoxy-L-arabinose transferase-like glycosyltransferase